MIRFFFFLIGIACGFAAAIITLPLPGKTFFNRMSKLPPGTRGLIDNSIELGISLFRLASTGAKEFSLKANQVAKETNEKIKEVKARYDAERLRAQEAEKTMVEHVVSEVKEKVGV